MTTTNNMNDSSKQTGHPAVMAWRVTLILYTCLLLTLTIDHLFLRQTFYLVVWTIQTLPLLLVLPGLLRKTARSGIWLCFMILFHFLVAINQLAVSQHVLFYSAMTGLILSLFTASLLFARWQNRS